MKYHHAKHLFMQDDRLKSLLTRQDLPDVQRSMYQLSQKSAEEAVRAESAADIWCILALGGKPRINSVSIPINLLLWTRLCRRPRRSAAILPTPPTYFSCFLASESKSANYGRFAKISKN